MKKRIQLTKGHSQIWGVHVIANRKAGQNYDVVRIISPDCVECYDAENDCFFIVWNDFFFIS